MSQYDRLGVDADKRGVHTIFAPGIKQGSPGAFVNIATHRMFPQYVTTLHGDGVGSKVIPYLIMYHYTGDPKWLSRMVLDAFSMNMSDVAAAGFVAPDCCFQVIDMLGINRFNVPKDILLRAIRSGVDEVFALYKRHEYRMLDFLGGETADLPRQVHTAVFDIAVSATMLGANVIRGNVEPGDMVWGFASDGQAVWEHEPNSGIMSNGLTHAANCLISPSILSGADVPGMLPAGETFAGRFGFDDRVDELAVPVLEALLSPTRQWAILITRLIQKLKVMGDFSLLHGISINTGGGATKVRNLGVGGITYEKHMPDPPPIFRVIQNESGETWENMLRTYNCGVGIDIIGKPGLETYLREVERDTGVRLYALGNCFVSAGQNVVKLDTPFGQFEY